MKVEFDVTLEAQDLFRFNMYQTYTGIHGIISILIALIVFVIAGISGANGAYAYMALYLFIGIVVLFYIPFTLRARAKHTMKTNAVLAHTLHYTLTEDSIAVTQGEESGELPWDQIYKMVSTRNQILIYSTRINAYVIPREQLGELYEQVKQLAQQQLPKYRVKL